MHTHILIFTRTNYNTIAFLRDETPYAHVVCTSRLTPSSDVTFLRYIRAPPTCVRCIFIPVITHDPLYTPDLRVISRAYYRHVLHKSMISRRNVPFIGMIRLFLFLGKDCLAYTY